MSLPAALLATTGAVWRSIGLVCVVVAAALAAAEMFGVATLGATYWTLPLAFLALGVVHELGHVAAVYVLGGRVSRVVASGRSHVSVSHGALGRGRDAWCIVAGPAAPVLVAVLLLPLGLSTDYMFLIGAIAVGHLLTLAVPVGDGRELRLVLREHPTA